MMSKTASVTSSVQEPVRQEPLRQDSTEAAKIPLKGSGMDIASQMRTVEQAGPDLASAIGGHTSNVTQTLGVIDAIEATLQQKREQIEQIQVRQEILAREYRQLGDTLDAATRDLAEQFIDIIADLESSQFAEPSEAGPIEQAPVPTVIPAAAPATPPAAPNGAESSAPIPTAPDADPSSFEREAGEAKAEPAATEAADTGKDIAADKPSASEDGLDLDLELSELPPVPEFLGGTQQSADQKDDNGSRSADSGSRPWWKHGKKG